MEDDIGVTLTAMPTRIAYDVSVTAVAARSLSILGREAVDLITQIKLRLLDLNRHFTPITLQFTLEYTPNNIYITALESVRYIDTENPRTGWARQRVSKVLIRY